MSEDRSRRDPFDRLVGSIDGLPGVRKSRPSTVSSVVPMLGDSQTYVVQTYQTEEGFYGLVQVVSADGGSRFVLPPKVMAAVYRQREGLISSGRKARGRERWENLSAEDREARVARLRRPTG